MVWRIICLTDKLESEYYRYAQSLLLEMKKQIKY
jgi:hypothetical protein